MINWIRRWWMGPEAQNAWQFHPDHRGTRIRTWPVRFENEDRLRSFIDDILTKRPDSYPDAQAFTCELSVPDMGYRHETDLDAFLRGRSAQALRTFFLNARNNDGNVNDRNVQFYAGGQVVREAPRRGNGRYFVSYGVFQGRGEVHEMEWHRQGFEREIEAHTVPLTRLQRWRKVSSVEPFDGRTVEQKRENSKVRLWAWSGSFVIAVFAAWLQGKVWPGA